MNLDNSIFNLIELGNKLHQDKIKELPRKKSLIVFEPKKLKDEFIFDKLFDSQEMVSMNKTVGLTYRIYTRFEHDQNKKVSCEVWKFKQDPSYYNLLKFVFLNNEINDFSVIIIIDLTDPESFHENLINLVNFLKTFINKFNEENSQKITNSSDYMKLVDENKSKQNDREFFPLPLIIIGINLNSYLQFKNEKKNLIEKLLRHFAYKNFFQLFFIDEMCEYSRNRLRLMLQKTAFDSIIYQNLKSTLKDKLLYFSYDNNKLANIYGENLVKWNEILNEFKEQFGKNFISKKELNQDKIKVFKEPDIDLIYDFNIQKLDSKIFKV